MSFPKFWGKKPKATTKVTLNEPPMMLVFFLPKKVQLLVFEHRSIWMSWTLQNYAGTSNFLTHDKSGTQNSNTSFFTNKCLNESLPLFKEMILENEMRWSKYSGFWTLVTLSRSCHFYWTQLQTVLPKVFFCCEWVFIRIQQIHKMYP